MAAFAVFDVFLFDGYSDADPLYQLTVLYSHWWCIEFHIKSTNVVLCWLSLVNTCGRNNEWSCRWTEHMLKANVLITSKPSFTNILIGAVILDQTGTVNEKKFQNHPLSLTYTRQGRRSVNGVSIIWAGRSSCLRLMFDWLIKCGSPRNNNIFLSCSSVIERFTRNTIVQYK